MIRSNKSKEQILRDAFGLLTNGRIPDDIFNEYIDNVDGDGSWRIQEWCVNNMKESIADWCTGIGIIEAVEHLYDVALENGNIKTE